MAQGAGSDQVVDDVAILEAIVDEQAKQIVDQSGQIKDLEAELRLWRNNLFGRRTEAIHPDQLRLFEATTESTQEFEDYEIPARTGKRKKGHGRGKFPAHLPREEIRLELPEDQQCCPECGERMRAFGEDVCERGHIVPAKMSVRRYVRAKYSCSKGHAIKTAPMPGGVVDGGKYEASVYAHIVVAKYEDHSPLNRLQKIFKRHGIQVPRQSMWDMLVRVDELVAQPVLTQMRAELLQEDALHADETPVTYRLEEGKGAKTGYIWVWRSLREQGKSKVLIEFKTSRSANGPKTFLGSWSGALLTDGYSGYDSTLR